MKRTCWHFLMLVALSSGAFAQGERELWDRDKPVTDVRRASAPSAQPALDDERELKRLVTEWDAALMNRDTKMLERILADDFTFISMNGVVTERSKYLANVRASTLVYDSLASSDVTVRLYGNTAVVFAYGEAKGKSGAETFSTQYRYMDVWVKRGGAWQAVATQVTRLESR